MRYLLIKNDISDPTEIYNKAGLDKSYWSKLISGKNEKPSKYRLILIGFALELSASEIIGLLESAGYTFIPSSKYDSILFFFFVKNYYNIKKIDDVLSDEFSLDTISEKSFR